MLRINIVILYVLSILSRSSSLEYLPSNIEKDNEGWDTNMDFIYRIEEKESPTKGELPVAYLYMAKEKQPPAKKQCITCLYELYQKVGGNLDACECLPCWIQTSKEEEVQKFVIGIFEKHYCDETKYRKRSRQKKAERKFDNSSNRGKTERQQSRIDSLENGWRTKLREVKHPDGYINEQGDLEQVHQDVGQMKNTKKNAGKSRSSKNLRFSSTLRKCSGEDCEVTEMTRPVQDKSTEVEKEKVKRIFNTVLNKMARINSANEEEKVTESPKDSIKDRWLKNQKSEDKPQWPAVKRYQNQYQKPLYRVQSHRNREKENLERNEQKSDPSVDEEEVKPKDKESEEITEMEISKLMNSNDRKSKIPKKDESIISNSSEAIPEDISIGSLVYENPLRGVYRDNEEIEDEDDEVRDDEFTSPRTSIEESHNLQRHEKDYTIHYDDDMSEEESPKRTQSNEGQKSFHDTRNTPSVEDRISTTAGTPIIDNKRSETSETTTCAVQMAENKLSSKSSTTTEEPSSMFTSEESDSTVSSDESSSGKQDGKKRSNIITNSTEGKSAEEADADSDNSSRKTSPMIDDPTTVLPTWTTVLKFTNSNRFKESLEKIEEAATETLRNSKSSNSIGLAYEFSSESVTDTPEKHGTTVRFGKKFTRSTNPTTSGSKETWQGRDNVEETVAVTSESTGVDRYLRQTDCRETASEATRADEKKKATVLSGTGKQRSGDVDENIRQQKNPRYIVELEEDPDTSGKEWSPEKPILKVKMNIYSDLRSGDVYNFLSKLIPKDKNRDENGREETSTPRKEKNLQSEASNRRRSPKLLSI